VLAVNAIAVTWFYRRYRASSFPPDESQVRTPASPPVSPASPVGIRDRHGGARQASALSPTVLSVGGLLASLFLLAFGLLIPFLFLLGAFLVYLAEAAREPSAAGSGTPRDWVFPAVSFASTVALLAAIGLSLTL